MIKRLELIPRTDRFLSLLPEIGMFGRVFGDFGLPEVFRSESEILPAFNVSETEKEYKVTGEIPGMKAEDLDVSLTDGMLTIKGEKKEEKEEKEEHYHRIERRYGSFHRSFHLPENVDTDASKATYKDGVLTLTLKKSGESKTKKIEITKNKTRKISKEHEKIQ